MKNFRVSVTTNEQVRSKIFNFNNYNNSSYPTIITVKRVQLKAQNFKNKTIKQSYSIDFLPTLPYLYINTTNIYAKKIGFQRFVNSDLYYTYNIKGEKRPGYYITPIKKGLSKLNKDLFKLRKSDKPLDLLSDLFDENIWEQNLKKWDLYQYCGVIWDFELRAEIYEKGNPKGYSCFFHIYLHSWRKFILETYRNKVINLDLETLKSYNAHGLAKLQALLDFSELGYELLSKNNPLENLFYYIKEEKEFKTPVALEELKRKQNHYFLFYLKNLHNYIEKNREKEFFKDYVKKFEPNKFEGTPYSWQALNDGFAYLNKLHFLDKPYKIFDLKLINEYGLSHFGQKHLYLQNYIYTEGPGLTAGLALQKIKYLNIAGVKIKKNSFLYKLNLEQISLISFIIYLRT